jgi:hypothetical protein
MVADIIIALVTGVIFFMLGRWEGRRSQMALASEVEQVPVQTASIVESVLAPLLEDARAGESVRGWDMEYRATVGYANLTGKEEPPMDLLIEYPVGAHSCALIVLEEDVMENTVRLLGQLFNGVGFSFHVDDFMGGRHTEVGTVDYIRNLPIERPLFDAPIQAVYYRWGGKGFEEVGRGPVYDPREHDEPPPSVRRFMGKSWTVAAGGDEDLEDFGPEP